MAAFHAAAARPRKLMRQLGSTIIHFDYVGPVTACSPACIHQTLTRLLCAAGLLLRKCLREPGSQSQGVAAGRATKTDHRHVQLRGPQTGTLQAPADHGSPKSLS